MLPYPHPGGLPSGLPPQTSTHTTATHDHPTTASTIAHPPPLHPIAPAGYVEQFDTLIPTLTVSEMLMYTAELKRSISEPLQSKREAVDELLQKLALESCRDVVVGNAFVKGISGGQAKRTNIGIALITNPRVLFLDEPTSGLDSYTANEVRCSTAAGGAQRVWGWVWEC
jgi:ABC-type multidrug transport system ATPase subunit